MTINFYNPSFSFEEDKASCYWFLQSFLLYTRVKIAALFFKNRDHPNLATQYTPPALSYLV